MSLATQNSLPSILMITRHVSQSHSRVITLSLTYGDVVVVSPGVYPVDGGAHAPALAAVLLVPQQQTHPVSRVAVADVAGQEGGVPVLVGDLLDPLHPGEVRPQGPRQEPSHQHPQWDHHESLAAGHFLEQKSLMKHNKIHFRDYKKGALLKPMAWLCCTENKTLLAFIRE